MMKFKIKGIREPGNLDKERVVIEILEDGNVGTLIITSTSIQTENSVSPKIKNPYWVPDQDVKKGDLIVVYTKSGKKNTRVNEDNTSSYFFYIGIEEAVYGDSKNTPVVFDIGNWQFLRRN